MKPSISPRNTSIEALKSQLTSRLSDRKRAPENIMLTARERVETIRQWQDTPITPSVVLAKCAAGLALVAGIALSGSLYEAPPAPHAQAADARIELNQMQLVGGDEQEIAAQAAPAGSASRAAVQAPDQRSVSD
jgi:hypothetical protein